MKKKFLILTALLALSGTALAKPQPLKVYTYDGFKDAAGPSVKEGFEKSHSQCQVEYVVFDNNAALFNRVRLDGKKLKADVVVGLDQHQIANANKLGVFAENKLDLNRLSLPLKWTNQTFIPFDFGEYAFIYDKNKIKNPPKSLKELVERQDIKVLYQDPRTSSVGRGLLVLMNQVYPENEIANAWKTLKKHTVTVGKGWTETYGAFLKGEGDMVLSFNTSPIYHLLDKDDKRDYYAATEFAEGGVLQIEVAAKVAKSKNPCAEQFLDYLISPEAQKNITLNNIMLPVIDVAVEEHYDALSKHQKGLRVFDTTNVTPEQYKNWLDVWQNALSE